ncbi:MAG: hypothetical protein CMF45_08595 [Legionellales bacterium]|nr:hypothetical protein [Legionellales bacterium]
MKVHCKYDKLVAVKDIKPNPKNPNIHPKQQIELLAKVLQETGWRAPIVVSNRSGLVVKGHGRLAAAQRAGMKEVPVDFQDYESADEERADLLADNKLAELSDTDKDLVKSLLGDFSEGFDMSLTGFKQDEFIKEATEQAGVVEETPQYPIVPVHGESNSALVVVCKTDAEEQRLRDLFFLTDAISYKSDKVGTTYVITADEIIRVMESW